MRSGWMAARRSFTAAILLAPCFRRSLGQGLGGASQVVDTDGQPLGPVGREVEVEAVEGRVDQGDDPAYAPGRRPATDQVVLQPGRPPRVARARVREVGLLPQQPGRGGLAVDVEAAVEGLRLVRRPQGVDART